MMAKKKSPLLAAPFQGKWRIAEMDLWDDDAINLVGQGFVDIKGQTGEMQFIDVTACLDIRYDTRGGELIAEFVLAMKHGLGLNKILGTIHTYPTLAEANKYAAGEWKRAHQPKKLLEWVARYHNWKRG